MVENLPPSDECFGQGDPIPLIASVHSMAAIAELTTPLCEELLGDCPSDSVRVELPKGSMKFFDPSTFRLSRMRLEPRVRAWFQLAA